MWRGRGLMPPAFAMRSLFDPLLPGGVVVVATRTEVEAALFPEEEPAVSRAVEGRRREFATGRACAREALVRLGLPPQAIGAEATGAPLWPDGVVGSITHCRGCRAAAVGRAAEFGAIGIDAEPDRRLSGETLRAIALPIELGRVRQLQWQAPGICWDRLLFSAKESVYKAWSPFTGASLGFEDAEIGFDLGAGSFFARLRKPGPARWGSPPVLRGRWSADGGLVATAIALPTPDCPERRGH